MIKVALPFLMFFCYETTYSQTVMLDYYFNHETRTSKDGRKEKYHYTWEDTTQTGFSKFGAAFAKLGAHIAALNEAPALKNLATAKVYIIVDPDSKKENSDPNYITEKDADVITSWVKAGGHLLLLANDSANTDLEHFNILAGKFGLHFNNDLQMHVIDDAYFEDGAILLNNDHIFRSARKIYLKDVCSIDISGEARPILKSKNKSIVAAKATYGKGFVIAVGDPWLYNEYVNGRLPAGFENSKAMADLAAYLLH